MCCIQPLEVDFHFRELQGGATTQEGQLPKLEQVSHAEAQVPQNPIQWETVYHLMSVCLSFHKETNVQSASKRSAVLPGHCTMHMVTPQVSQGLLQTYSLQMAPRVSLKDLFLSI